MKKSVVLLAFSSSARVNPDNKNMAAKGIAKRLVTATPFVLAGELMFPVAPTLGWLIRIGKVRIVIAKATIARQHIRHTLFK